MVVLTRLRLNPLRLNPDWIAPIGPNCTGDDIGSVTSGRDTNALEFGQTLQ